MTSSLIPAFYSLLLLAAGACAHSSANPARDIPGRQPAALKPQKSVVRTFLVQYGDSSRHKAVFDRIFDDSGKRMLNTRAHPGWPYFDRELAVDHVYSGDSVLLVTWPARDTVLTVTLNGDGKAVSFHAAAFLDFSAVNGTLIYNSDGTIAQCHYSHQKDGKLAVDRIAFRYDCWGNVLEIAHEAGAQLLRTELEYDYDAPLAGGLFLPQQVDENFLVLQYLQHAGLIDLLPHHEVRSTVTWPRKGAPGKLEYGQYKYGRMGEVTSYRYNHGVCHQWHDETFAVEY